MMKTRNSSHAVYSLLLTMAVVCFCAFSPAQAAPVPLDDSTGTVFFGDQVEYVEDPGRQLKLSDILSDKTKWTQSDKVALSFGFTSSAYWFRFTVNNTLDETRDWYFTILYPLLNHVELYIPQAGGLYPPPIKGGTAYPFGTREIEDRDLVFLIKQAPGLSTYLVRIETATSFNFEPVLKSHKAYLEKIHKVYPFFWLYYGAMLIMVIYNMVLYVLIREKSYIYLVLFILSYTLFQFTLNGFSFQYLWPNSVWWANKCLPMFMCLSVVFITLFLRTFLNIRDLYPDTLVDKVTKFFIIGPSLAWALLSLVVTYAYSIKIAIVLVIIMTVALVASGAISIGITRNSRFIIISCGFLFLGVLLYCFKTFGLLPVNAFTEWAVQVGSVLFVALLSVGLADRITALKDELLGSNANISLMLKSISQEAVDLTDDIKYSREDEIGEVLSTRFTTFMNKFRELVNDVTGSMGSLNQASHNLSGLSDKMTTETGEMSANANSVALASEEMSRRMTSIASTMEQTSQNVSLIASSIEEMTSTVDEITSNTETARGITANAVNQAGNVSRKLDTLNSAATNIGSVTEVITEISKKTNLLALNATIEAARAGDAGKGFAVVASEIKDLARQTAAATQQIIKQIEDNKNITVEAVDEIGRIINVINSVDEIVSTIATSIEEQSTSTKEIASNVSQISQGVSEVNTSVAQYSIVSGDVSRKVVSLSGHSQQMNENSQQVKKSADELRRMAAHITELMGKFKV
ncbi:MAG: 7TM diverse intracellular signaling domain-containing protein [Thermodesulfobacteriota bacterium]